MRLVYFSHSKSEYILSQAALRLVPFLPTGAALKERWNIDPGLAIVIGFICCIFANGSGEAVTPNNPSRGQVEQAPQDVDRRGRLPREDPPPPGLLAPPIATAIAMNYGFRFSAGIAMCLYLLAALVIKRLPCQPSIQSI